MKQANIFLIGGLIVVALIGIVWVVFDFSLKEQNKENALKENILEPQTNNEGGVAIVVRPQSIKENAASWNFEISLDTHSVELNEDLVEASVLIDKNGKEYQPVEWEGDSAGGHHRSGVLKFAPISPWPKMIELKIRGVNGIEQRIFRWNLSV